MTPATDIPSPSGDIVRVCSRRCLVEAVPPPLNPSDQTLARQSCLEDDAEREELEELWEKELNARRLTEADWSRLAQAQFDLPRYFTAYYPTLRWNTVTSTDPKLFQPPYCRGIPIQVEPLRKALLPPRVNLFTADDVALGKSNEAGLIVRELLKRQHVRSIVVAAPPSVLLQWKDDSGSASARRPSCSASTTCDACATSGVSR